MTFPALAGALFCLYHAITEKHSYDYDCNADGYSQHGSNGVLDNEVVNRL